MVCSFAKYWKRCFYECYTMTWNANPTDILSIAVDGTVTVTKITWAKLFAYDGAEGDRLGSSITMTEDADNGYAVVIYDMVFGNS